MTDPLYQLIYCSHMAASLDETPRILAVSRANNARDGLTGALLQKDGLFAQVLEGPLSAVERTFERIQCDARHDGVVVLRFAEVAERAFSEWSMADAGAATSPPARRRPTHVRGRPAVQAADEVLTVLRRLMNGTGDWAVAS